MQQEFAHLNSFKLVNDKRSTFLLVMERHLLNNIQQVDIVSA